MRSLKTPIIKSLQLITLFVMILTHMSCGESTTDSSTTMTELSEITPLIDSNTNWLLTCTEDQDCDEGVCSCGSCIIPCQETRGCSVDSMDEQRPRVTCAVADPVSEPDSCGDDYLRPMTRICLPQCEVDDECPEELVCHEGTCKRPRRGERRPPRIVCEEGRRCLESGEDPERCLLLCPSPCPEARECVEEGGEPEECIRLCPEGAMMPSPQP